MVDERAKLFDEMMAELSPVFKKTSVSGIVAVTLGGSHGKKLADAGSDHDFHLFCAQPAPPEVQRAVLAEVGALAGKWREHGLIIDGPMKRSYAEIEEQLDIWLSGKGTPLPVFWSVWGYQILTNIQNLAILSDPDGRVAAWHKRLEVYPDALRDALLKKYVLSLKYWKDDYHYKNKVRRGDVVFLASITARLVHDIMQVLFALNRVYFPGDGTNLDYARNFGVKPDDLEAKVTAILYPPENGGGFAGQYHSLTKLIDAVLALA